MIPLWHWHSCAINFVKNIFRNNPKHCFLGRNLTQLHTVQRCHWHCCNMHCTVVSLTPLCKYGTAVTLDLIFDGIWLPLKGISCVKTYIAKLSHTYIYNFHTASSLIRCGQNWGFRSRFSSPYSKRAWGGGLLDEKIRGRKSCIRVP
jgi:hypothetical protein